MGSRSTWHECANVRRILSGYWRGERCVGARGGRAERQTSPRPWAHVTAPASTSATVAQAARSRSTWSEACPARS